MSKGKKNRKPDPKKALQWVVLATAVADLIAKIVELFDRYCG